MMIMIMENVPISLRGELSRWLIELKAGVFVGQVSALVRDQLWKLCCDGVRDGRIIQLWSTNNEQRFDVRVFGDTTREIVDFDGLKLIRRK